MIEVIAQSRELPHVIPNAPRVLGPREYEVLRQSLPGLPVLNLEVWDGRVSVVFKRFRGMNPEYAGKFVEVLGKRKKKLKIRYAPAMEEHRGWNCDKEVREWVFFGGEEEFEGAQNLVFYFVFQRISECGARLHRGRVHEDVLIYQELVNVETGRVFHVFYKGWE